MSSFLTTVVIAGQLSLLSAVAGAESTPQANPSAETLGSVEPTSLTSIECPAPGQSVGDPVDDILAVVINPEFQPAFGSRGARELQGIEIMARIGE